MQTENLIGLALILGIVYVVSDALTGVEDAFGLDNSKLPASAPPAPPVMQTVKFSPNCPAGYISTSDPTGDPTIDCIQVTGAIHP